MTDAYRSIHEFRRLLHESCLRRATVMLKSVSSSAETSVDLYSEMRPCNLTSLRDASAQHKCTVQICGSVERRLITGTLYRAQPPLPLVISAVSALLAIPLLACAPDEREAGGKKSVASCQRPNDASNGTRAQGPTVVHSIKFPRFRAGVGVKGSCEVHAGGWCKERRHPVSRNHGLAVRCVLSKPRDGDHIKNTNTSSFPSLRSPTLPARTRCQHATRQPHKGCRASVERRIHVSDQEVAIDHLAASEMHRDGQTDLSIT